ncbi:MAG TPA: hypothetical protein VLM05_06685 [Mycobacteriales bacterium]|nr:hypothetical protein [Mycobacteriales bacterium]
MPEPERRRERPLLSAHVESLAEAVTAGEPLARLELAHATAAALVDAGRGDAGPETSRLVDLAETVGLDTLSELWRDSPPDSLPGALWALYLLRTWTERQGEAVARMYRAGRAYAPVDEVVAGVSDDADPAAVRALAESVLTGAYRGDFDVALERAAAFFRVVASGRRELGAEEIPLAERNEACADGLQRAASAWRAGTLQ